MPSNAEIRQSLFEAVSKDDLESVKEIVNQYGLSYCQGWSGGYTVLWNATKFGRDKIARFLVEKGAKVNSKGTEVNTPLHYAVWNCSAELVEMLIKKGASLDAQNLKKHSPLRIATDKEKTDIVRLLLSGGADCWTDNEPLFTACSRGFVEIAKLLLDFRMQKKFLSPEPLNSALFMAINQGSEEIVSALLKADADTNAVCAKDQYSSYRRFPTLPLPLLLVCRKGCVEIVKLLLEHGAKLDCSRQEDNYKPLHLASEFGHVEVVRHLLSIGVDPNAEANEAVTPLHLAVQSPCRGSMEVVELLLNSGANINAQTSNGSTPLHLSTQPRSDIAEFLLEKGACIKIKDKENNNALHLAVEKGGSSLVGEILKQNPDIDDEIKKLIIDIALNGNSFDGSVDALIEYGCTLNREDVSDPKMLPAAVKKGYAKLVECILKYGLDRGDVIYDPTLLHVAVKNGHPKIVELLLKSGYDINAVDKNGNKPIYYSMDCKEKGRWGEVFQILLAHGGVVEDVSKVLLKAVDQECFEMCKILIESCGADVNMQDTNGKTLLQIIVSKRIIYQTDQDQLDAQEGKIDESVPVEIMKLLLEHGADVLSETSGGLTLLHLTAFMGKKEATRILLQLGADVNAQAKTGYVNYDYLFRNDKRIENGPTALHLAAKEGFIEVVKVLLEFDADIGIREKINQTALHYAIVRNHDGIVKILLENSCDINFQNNGEETILDLCFERAKSTYKVEHIDYDDEFYSSGEDDPNYVHVLINPDDHLVSNMVKMHVIKLKTAGLHVDEKILEQLKLNPALIDFEPKCEEELSKMKREKLSCHLTLFDILVDSKNPAYVKNESLRKALEALDFDNYPIYGGLVKNSVEKNKRKIALLTAGKESLDILVKTGSVLNGKESPILLDEVTDKILSYLTTRELKSLMSSGEAIRTQMCK